ncbi:MAG: hypothetical protein JNM26_07185 [Ideonella sp.]|nr:hypothetical protein [Ideonella sp.]
MTRCATSDPGPHAQAARPRRPGVWFAALLIATLPAMPGTALPASPPASVVFWTAGDCSHCKVWKTGDRHDEFQAEAARLGVPLVTLAKPSLRSPDADYVVPEGALVPPLSTAPTTFPSFDFMCAGKPVRRRLSGLAEWDSFWRSQLRRLARDCQPASGS